MGDVLKLLEWLKSNPKAGWLPMVIALIVIVLIYETVKQLLPRVLEGVFKLFKGGVLRRSSLAKMEADIRRFCKKSRNVNWATSIPTIARYSLDIPIQDVFVLPKLAFHSGTGTVTVQEIGEILARNRILCITGTPGSGKSTLLNFVAVTFANETAPEELQLLESRIPICLDFREFVELPSAESFPDTLSLLFKRHGLSIGGDFFENVLQQGRCSLFLDGLEETGDDSTRTQIFRWVIGCMSTYSEKNRVLATCRDFEWEMARLPGVARAVIQPFSEEDARSYVEKFSVSLAARTDGINRQKFLQRFAELADGLSDAYYFLTSSPLLLTLAVSLLTLEINVPKHQADVLAIFVRTMLRDWQTLKGMPDSVLSTPNAQDLLEAIAYLSFAHVKESGVLSLNDREIVDTISAEPASACVWLDHIAARSGIISKTGDAQWVFSNRRILEYLVAKDLSRHPTRWQKYWVLPDWKDVYYFMPEVVQDPNVYLEWFERQGVPKTELHVLLTLRTVTALQGSVPGIRERLMVGVREYLHDTSDERKIVDAELLRLYIREDLSVFFSLLREQIKNIKIEKHRINYLDWSIRAGNLDANKFIANEFINFPPSVALEVLENIAKAPVPARLPIVRAAFYSNFAVNDISKSLINCGRDALDCLISIAKTEIRTELAARAFHLIAEFPDANATIFLFTLNNHKSSDEIKNVIERHLSVISKKSGADLVKILFQAKSTFYTRIGKRLFDFVFSLSVLFALAPLFCLFSVVIKSTSVGPVFSTARRLGRDGRPYNRIVFRTMRTQAFEDHVLTQSSQRDPRITRFGAFLRRTSLDDLPVFFSVLKGEMSIVGPRPLPGSIEIDPVTKAVLGRFRPGLLGKTQTDFRQSGSSLLTAQHFTDLSYMANCTFAGDLKIILRAIFIGFSWSSAY